MKKSIAILLSIIMILSLLTACGSNESTQTEVSSDQEESKVEPVVIQVGYANHPGEPFDLSGSQRMEEVA